MTVDSLNPPELPRVPLPKFRTTRDDPPPPETTGASPEGPGSRPSPPETAEPEGMHPDGPTEPPPPLPEPEGRTRTSWVGRGHGAGDPRQVARAVKGLLAIGFRIAQAVAYRRGRWFRLPTRDQLDGMTDPLGRIAVRYLPLDVLGPTLADVTECVAAAHDYTLDGPLTGRLDQAVATAGETE